MALFPHSHPVSLRLSLLALLGATALVACGSSGSERSEIDSGTHPDASDADALLGHDTGSPDGYASDARAVDGSSTDATVDAAPDARVDSAPPTDGGALQDAISD